MSNKSLICRPAGVNGTPIHEHEDEGADDYEDYGEDGDEYQSLLYITENVTMSGLSASGEQEVILDNLSMKIFELSEDMQRVVVTTENGEEVWDVIDPPIKMSPRSILYDGNYEFADTVYNAVQFDFASDSEAQTVFETLQDADGSWNVVLT